MTHDMVATPEGFLLSRPLVLPDVREFGDLFVAERPWSFSTMNHYNGNAGPDRPEDYEYGRLTFSRFCVIDRALDRGPTTMDGNQHLVVTPTGRVCSALLDQFAFEYRVGFEVILHADRDRCLVTASQMEFSSSRYVAYIKPESIPRIDSFVKEV